MGCGTVGVLTVDLHVPDAGSLKDKRRHVARLKAGLVKRFACSVAEVDHHDLHRRVRLTVAMVTREVSDADHLVEAAARWIDSDPETELIDAARTIVVVDADSPFLVGA